MALWNDRVVPWLVEKACRSSAILEERRRWIPRAEGDVLELGVGSGLNLAFFEHARAVTAIDPSAALLAKAAPRAREAPVPVELVRASAESLPLPDRRFDTVVVTYALCSMADPVRALREARRVLRPDGVLIFVEHGLAPDPRVRRWQRWLTPVWSRVGGGCRLDRDVPAVLAAGGFESIDLHAGYTDGARWLSYTYEGTARPR